MRALKMKVAENRKPQMLHKKVHTCNEENMCSFVTADWIFLEYTEKEVDDDQDCAHKHTKILITCDKWVKDVSKSKYFMPLKFALDNSCLLGRT